MFREKMIMEARGLISALKWANTYFKHKSLYNYTRVARGQDGMKVMSIIDLV